MIDSLDNTPGNNANKNYNINLDLNLNIRGLNPVNSTNNWCININSNINNNKTINTQQILHHHQLNKFSESATYNTTANTKVANHNYNSEKEIQNIGNIGQTQAKKVENIFAKRLVFDNGKNFPKFNTNESNSVLSKRKLFEKLDFGTIGIMSNVKATESLFSLENTKTKKLKEEDSLAKPINDNSKMVNLFSNNNLFSNTHNTKRSFSLAGRSEEHEHLSNSEFSFMQVDNNMNKPRSEFSFKKIDNFNNTRKIIYTNPQS